MIFFALTSTLFLSLAAAFWIIVSADNMEKLPTKAEMIALFLGLLPIFSGIATLWMLYVGQR